MLIGSIIIGIFYEIFSPKGIDAVSDITLTIMAIPFGFIICFGLFWILKNAWQGDELESTDNFPAQDIILKFGLFQ